MIGTGLVLWTVKRRRDQDKRLKAGQSVTFGFHLVEILNIATLAGLFTAVAAYFWANRLLPLDLPRRAQWEADAMFIVWGLLLGLVALRLRFAPSLCVWAEQFWLAAAAFGLLPLLNALTTDRHLGVTLPAGDWVLEGFDLTVLGLAAVFGFIAWKLRRKGALNAVAAQGREAVA
jgi:hypothetical protein